VIVSVRTVPI